MRFAFFIVCLAWMAGGLRAAVSIDLPEITVLPNTPGQAFDVLLQNGGDSFPVIGIGFNIQVADGGTAAGGHTNGPAIAFVDIFAGTVFATNNNGPSGSGSIVPQVYERGTMTRRDTTVTIEQGASKVATVTLDTTGIGSGTFALTLKTRNGPAKYLGLSGDVFPTLMDGSVTVAAQPSIAGITLHPPSRVALTFQTTAGVQYSVQQAQTVTTAVWTDVLHAMSAGDPLTLSTQKGTGAPLTVFLESPPASSVFYRIHMTPGES
ncbi:MAG TPA: hypothetical protein P5022_01015 [Candidatus Paceibacterota bacterium]|nr:hypothetical protein [Verrucomicrobiota bacterium]HOX01115.1 hypothetical protein [Verrucomicrobiota bacterium]HRZ91463.1 hypothetical protein [Candidatus Paceibacterota bacterium]